MIDYSDRTVYEYLNNPFLADCGIPDLNITHMQKYDSPLPPQKISLYPWSSYILHFFASGNSVSTFTDPCESFQVKLDVFTLFLFQSKLKMVMIFLVPTFGWTLCHAIRTLVCWAYFQSYFRAKPLARFLVFCSQYITISLENISSVSTNCSRDCYR